MMRLGKAYPYMAMFYISLFRVVYTYQYPYF